MQRKTKRIIFLFLVALAVIISCSYCRYYSVNRVTLDEQQVSKDFLDFSVQKKKLPKAEDEVSLIAVGDISYSRSVGRAVEKQKDINYPFLKIKDYLSDADLVFGNLETPITQGREIQNLEMIFRSNPGTEQALKQAGFSILSLANNHTPNFGEQGLVDTFGYLDMAGIKHVGAGVDEQLAGQPVYTEVKGIKFTFLAYNDPDVVPAYYEATATSSGTAFMRINKMIRAVRDAKQKADFVIVSMHSGIEYNSGPDNSQVNFAHAAIDAGADLIIGHHPHVVQTMEQYKGKYIFYSLGNFVFDQPQTQETKDGLMIKVYFTRDRVNKISLFPVTMKSLAQPQIADSDEAKKILDRLNFSLADRVSYYWNGVKNNFEESSIPTIYNNQKTETGSHEREYTSLEKNSIQTTYSLKNGQMTISEKSKIIWQSPSDWWIDDFVLADSNNDGITDINMSVWKPGDFGISKPFWVKENDMSIKNHFFIFDLVDGVMKPIWQSSNLEAPNCKFAIADIDGDGKNDLVVNEGNYSQKPECNGNYIAVWKWNGWGFSNEWRSKEGNYNDIEIEKIDRGNYVSADTF